MNIKKFLRVSFALILGLTLVGCSNNKKENTKIDGVDYTKWEADLDTYGGNLNHYALQEVRKNNKKTTYPVGAYIRTSDDKITEFTTVKTLSSGYIAELLKIDEKDVKEGQDFIKGDNYQFLQVDHYYYNKIMSLATGIKDFDLNNMDEYEADGKLDKFDSYGIEILEPAYSIGNSYGSEMAVGVKINIEKALANIQDENMQNVLRYLRLLGGYDEAGNCFYYSKLLRAKYENTDRNNNFLAAFSYNMNVADQEEGNIGAVSYEGNDVEVVLENNNLTSWVSLK